MENKAHTISPRILKSIRRSYGHTQESFAAVLGFSSGRHIRALENGERQITKRTVALLKLHYPKEFEDDVR